jgi:hypothetical protein
MAQKPNEQILTYASYHDPPNTIRLVQFWGEPWKKRYLVEGFILSKRFLKYLLNRSNRMLLHPIG